MDAVNEASTVATVPDDGLSVDGLSVASTKTTPSEAHPQQQQQEETLVNILIPVSLVKVDKIPLPTMSTSDYARALLQKNEELEQIISQKNQIISQKIGEIEKQHGEIEQLKAKIRTLELEVLKPPPQINQVDHPQLSNTSTSPRSTGSGGQESAKSTTADPGVADNNIAAEVQAATSGSDSGVLSNPNTEFMQDQISYRYGKKSDFFTKKPTPVGLLANVRTLVDDPSLENSPPIATRTQQLFASFALSTKSEPSPS